MYRNMSEEQYWAMLRKNINMKINEVRSIYGCNRKTAGYIISRKVRRPKFKQLPLL